MKTLLRWLFAIVSTVMATTALAEFHTYQIEQLFSDASGNVQYIVLHESQGMAAEYFWMGNAITSVQPGVTKAYIFPNNLPVGMSCNPYP